VLYVNRRKVTSWYIGLSARSAVYYEAGSSLRQNDEIGVSSSVRCRNKPEQISGHTDNKVISNSGHWSHSGTPCIHTSSPHINPSTSGIP
jgi:hypothetical protein